MGQRTRRLVWLLVAVVGMAVAAGIGILVAGARRPAQRLTDGSTLTLLAVTYGSKHRLVEGEWWQTLFAPMLPDRLRPQLNRYTSVYTADHPKTLVLWTHQQKMTPASHWDAEIWETRVVASDEHGCRAETGFPTTAGADLGWPSVECYRAWALPAFPRRGRTVGVQIEERAGGSAWTQVAHFVVANPDPGPTRSGSPQHCR
jgi:hypothetical protein